MPKKKTWEKLEERVRTIASYIWNCPARPEEINGVKCDAVLKPESDRWIILEVTESDTLDKLRTDLAKFASVRPYLIAQGVYSKCLFVCSNPPTDSLIETGKGHNVEVLSKDDLEKRFFEYARYHFTRASKRFGSAVDPFSGQKDQRPYIPVRYLEGYRHNIEY